MELTTYQRELVDNEVFTVKGDFNGHPPPAVLDLVRVGLVEEDKEVSMAGNEIRFKVNQEMKDKYFPTIPRPEPLKTARKEEGTKEDKESVKDKLTSFLGGSDGQD